MSVTTKDRCVGLFRLLFGAMVMVHVIDLIMSGALDYFFKDPVIHLKYPMLEWLICPPMEWINLIAWVLAGACLLLSIGLATRISSLIVAIGYGWLLWSDVSFFKHHHYLFWLVSVLLAMIPTNRFLSVDGVINFDQRHGISNLEILTLKVMMVIPYFFGGLSKLVNPEWISGQTVAFILDQKFGDQWFVDGLSSMMTYGGMTFDLVIPILFFIPRLRILALVLAIGFNVTNFFMFTIDVFPLVMLAGAILFVYPFEQSSGSAAEKMVKTSVRRKIALSTFLLVQFLFPLRHLAIPGNMFLTGEGYMAGWNMIDSLTKTELTITVVDLNKKLHYQVDAQDYLTKRQVSTVGRFPEFLPQVADHIATKASMWNIDSVAVTANILVSRNGQEPVMAVDNQANLIGKRSRFLKHADWILLN